MCPVPTPILFDHEGRVDSYLLLKNAAIPILQPQIDCLLLIQTIMKTWGYTEINVCMCGGVDISVLHDSP
jgi:hypothetical protein